MKESFWTEARVERLRILNRRGWSASRIARDLGATSRNAVIGKTHRLGISGEKPISFRKSAMRRGGASLNQPKNKDNPRIPHGPSGKLDSEPTHPLNMPEHSVANPATMTEISRGSRFADLTAGACMWPIHEDAEGYIFCGCAAIKSESYCRRHKDVSVMPAQEMGVSCKRS